MTKLIGYILLLISCVLFGLILVVPWMSFSKSQIAWITTTLFIVGEILFYLSIFLIGKNFIVKVKDRLVFWKTKSVNNPISEEVKQ